MFCSNYFTLWRYESADEAPKAGKDVHGIHLGCWLNVVVIVVIFIQLFSHCKDNC